VPDQRKDYTKARTLPDLSIPPGLSSGAIRDKMSIPEEVAQGDRAYSDFQDRRKNKKNRNRLAEGATELDLDDTKMPVAEISMMDDQHVLVIEAARLDLWRKLKEFWKSEGFELELDDSDLGVLETTWLESKNKIERNRYKVFAEAGKNEGTTIIFLSHQSQDLITVDKAYGEDYEWGEVVRDIKKEAAIVERLRTSLETEKQRMAVSSTNDTTSTTIPYNPNEDFAQRMRPRKMKALKESSRQPEKTSLRSSEPSSQPLSAISTEEDEASYNATEDFAREARPEKMNQPSKEEKSISRRSQLESTRELEQGSYPAYSAPENPKSVKLVSVGRGKYYLTLESDFNDGWKSIKRALDVADVSVRRADKGRGVFVVNLVEGGYGESAGWEKLRFWKSDRPTQYQVSVTGIGDKTEIVILDPDGRWITSHEAERLLDRIYNALVSG